MTEEALADKWLQLTKKDFQMYLVQGISLRFQLEYCLRMKWLNEQTDKIMKSVTNQANPEPLIQ